MFGWFKTTDRIFWISALLLSVFIVTPARAAGTFTLTPYQDQSSITVTGPEGTHVAPNIFPLYVNDTLTEKVSAGLVCSGTNSGGQECKIDSETFSYSNIAITYSPDGVQAFQPGTGSVGYGSLNGATGDATLTATFPKAGYYLISYGVHVDYTSATCGDSSLDGSVQLSFAVQAMDFSMMPNPTSLDIVRGFDASTLVTITPIDNFAGTVYFSMYGQKGIVANGSATPAKPDYATVGVLSSVPLGAYPLTLRGTATIGSVQLAHDVPMMINVLPFQIDGPYDNSNSCSPSATQTPSAAAPNTRNMDSSITTDSVLTYKQIANDGTAYYRWLGDNSTWDSFQGVSIGLGPFTSHESTFSSYDWTTSYVQFETSSGGATFSPGPGYAYTGSTALQNAKGSVGSETITLKASLKDGASGTTTYTIRWHYPSENWRTFSADPSIFAIAPNTAAYYNPPNGGSSTTKMTPGEDAQFVIPSSKDETPGLDGGTISVYLGGASAAWPGLAEAAGLGTGPIGWGFAAVLAAAGAQAATLTPPAPTQQVHNGNYAEYLGELDLESRYPSGFPTNWHHFVSSGRNKITLAKALAEAQYVTQNYPGDQGRDDIYYTPTSAGSSMTFTGATAVTSRLDHYIGDGFGKQGFTGPVYRDLNVFTNYTPEFQWAYYAP